MDEFKGQPTFGHVANAEDSYMLELLFQLKSLILIRILTIKGTWRPHE